MALTQVSTNGIKDATIATADIADDAVTADKLANSINTEITANTAKVTNATHTGEVTGSVALTIANDAVTGAKIADDAVGAEHIEVLDAALQFGDSVKAQFGASNDLEIYFDGTDSIFTSAGKFRFKHGTDTAIKTLVDGGVYLSHDNSIKFYTTASGIFVGGHIDLDDNSELQIGTGDDLKIYHDGSNSYINHGGTGNLRLVGNSNIILQDNNAETLASFNPNGAVELYYDNSKKLETTSTGATISGLLTVSGSTSQTSTFTGNGLSVVHASGSNMFIGTQSGADGKICMVNNTDLQFWTNNTERLRIDSSGKVGVGLTSPASPLHLHESSSGSIEGLKVTNSTTGTAAGDGLSIGLDSSENVFIYNYESTAIRFGTSGSERMRILSGGGLTFNGDTATANALDDYEEGTFTPTLSYWSGGSGVSYAAQEGQYTKIGNTVFFKLRVNLSSKGSSSGYNVVFQGLPFTPILSTVANPMFQFNAVTGCNLASGSKVPWCQINDGTAKIVVYMFDYGGNGDYDDVLISHIDDDLSAAVTGHYYV